MVTGARPLFWTLLFAALALPTHVRAQGASSVENGVAQDSLSQVAARLFGQRVVRISLPTDAPDLILLEPHLVDDTLEFARYALGAWTLDTATGGHQILLTEITRLQIRSSAWDRGALVGFLVGATAAEAAGTGAKFRIESGERVFAGLLFGVAGAVLGGLAGSPFHRWVTVYPP